MVTEGEKNEMLSEGFDNVKVVEVKSDLPGFRWKKGRSKTLFCDFGSFRYIISPHVVRNFETVSYMPTLNYGGSVIWAGSSNGVEKDKAKILCWQHRIKMIGEMLS